MDNNRDSDIQCTLPAVLEAAQTASLKLLPEKSQQRYQYAYDQFLEWRQRKQMKSSFSESVLLAYMDELSNNLCPSTLWIQYSMLRSTLYAYHNIDISKYLKLRAFLKRKGDGYKPKKAKTLTPEEVNQFILRAPDEKFLFTNVVLVLGISGACRKHELIQLTLDDIRGIGSAAVVYIKNTKNKIARSFTIIGQFNDFYKKYASLRPQTTHQRFFLNYQHGKCTHQVVGINKMGTVPKTVATFLKLDKPEEYTGHSFRRSSATILVDAGRDLTTLKRHGGWKSSSIAEGYIDDSAINRMNIAHKSMGAVSDPTNEPTGLSNLMQKCSEENLSPIPPVEETQPTQPLPCNTVTNNQNIQETLENGVTNSLLQTPLQFTSYYNNNFTFNFYNISEKK